MARKRFHTVERLNRIAVKAIAEGYGKEVPFRDGSHRRMVHMDLAMDCEKPVAFELHSRTSAQHGKVVKPITITAQTRCRKCEACMERRANFWMARAYDEYAMWPRTLFGTFTMSPE